METYIQVSFWLGLFAVVVNIIKISSVNYPKTKVETLGFKVAEVLSTSAFVAWAGFLLFLN